ncbi:MULTISPECIES: SMI1/KNR4 family protein [unclassified Streptomyces]|uniref:SMI1/KNR4 family protein n=1 Tax=unclassified Streptomyces TaxID=2593676 RepID=UPI0037B89F26
MTTEEGARLGSEAARRLARLGRADVLPGLSAEEFARIEEEFGFAFSDDHRAFLAAGLPVDRPSPTEHRRSWPNWRDGDPDELRERLARPVEGVLFDVEHNAFWSPHWGAKPDTSSRALDVARRELASVPQMAPVYAHRYLPAARGTYGHPVLSMHQTDVIHYGADLADYIDREFNGPPRGENASHPRSTVAFWRDLVE